MASKKENIKALFVNTRTRVIIVFTLLLLIFAVVFGLIKGHKIMEAGTEATATLTRTGSIESIPGQLNPTDQYAKLQEAQNVNQAEQAAKTGTSAIPTIIRTQRIGEGVEMITPNSGESGVGFVTLSRESELSSQKSLWIEALKAGSCSKMAIDGVMAKGATLADIKSGCSCQQLKDNGYTLKDLEPICPCKDLKAAGYSALQLKAVGYSAGRLRDCGFIACEVAGAGFTAQEMKDGGFSDGELKGSGFSELDIKRAQGLPDNVSLDDVRKAGCDVQALTKLRNAGVSAAAIKRISGCSAEALKAAGFSALDLKNAGFSAAELKKAGFSAQALKDAGFTAKDLLNAGFDPDELANAQISQAEIERAQNELPPGITLQDIKNKGCDPDTLMLARQSGVSAEMIRKQAGCSQAAIDAVWKKDGCSPELLQKAFRARISAKTIKDTLGCSTKALKDAGYSAAQLRDAGFSAAELKNGGADVNALKTAGFSAKELRDAGFNAQELKTTGLKAKDLMEAGFTPLDLKNAGFTGAQLKEAGVSAQALKQAGYNQAALKALGFTPDELKNAGFIVEEKPAEVIKPTSGPSIPTIGGRQTRAEAEAAASQAQLQALLEKQNQQAAEQRYQQRIAQRMSEMLATANQNLQTWAQVDTQVYEQGTERDEDKNKSSVQSVNAQGQVINAQNAGAQGPIQGMMAKPAMVKAGDILFAVIDTSINSDEPGPILATIVSGKLKGSKLIGSFNLPANGEKMVITFNTLSIPGASGTIGINAFAIDPNTARTALSSRTDHHYLMRYGSLFAASFIEGFGNAVQTANTTITIGGTGGLTTTTVQNNRQNGSGGTLTLENAVIALSAVGKNWAQVAQQLVNRPTTVEVFSGTGIGVLFTQDLASL
jgi:intracellular multiplication protein IcmE